MKKLFLICLLIPSISNADVLTIQECKSDVVKYKTALSAAKDYISACEQQNILFDKKAQDADRATKEAIEIASRENLFGLSTTEWVMIGGAAGFVGGVFLTTRLK